MPRPSLETRFLARMREMGLGASPTHLLVAISGGRDSVTLLHLLRSVARELDLSLMAAHLDHAIRPESAADARWVAGLCHGWEIPLIMDRLPAPPTGEDAARRERYRFLRRVAAGAGTDAILTAHHADDQAETVLFRVLRGTGLEGLAGIPERTAGGLLRPLLPFWREELIGYARGAGLRWREDASNDEMDAARNRIRHLILPEAERISPGARRNLVSLAHLARDAEHALAAQTRAAEDALVRECGESLVLARGPLRDYDFAVATGLLRSLLRRLGVVPGRTGTRTALQFITDAQSGRELHLAGGVRIRLEYDEARIEREAEVAADEELAIPAVAPGKPTSSLLTVGGRTHRVRFWRSVWEGSPPGVAADGFRVAIDLAAARPPFLLRGWRRGDRVKTSGGTKTLKKLFAEERVPRAERGRLPVLEDATGRILWVAGSRRAIPAAPEPGADVIFLTITNA